MNRQRLWLKPAPGSEKLETTGLIKIAGISTVEILKVRGKRVFIRHEITGGTGPDEYWAFEGDTIKSNINLEIQ